MLHTKYGHQSHTHFEYELHSTKTKNTNYLSTCCATEILSQECCMPSRIYFMKSKTQPAFGICGEHNC
jgi:hypothetical protein